LFYRAEANDVAARAFERLEFRSPKAGLTFYLTPTPTLRATWLRTVNAKQLPIRVQARGLSVRPRSVMCVNGSRRCRL
jgi:hypothetical protein